MPNISTESGPSLVDFYEGIATQATHIALEDIDTQGEVVEKHDEGIQGQDAQIAALEKELRDAKGFWNKGNRRDIESNIQRAKRDRKRLDEERKPDEMLLRGYMAPASNLFPHLDPNDVDSNDAKPRFVSSKTVLRALSPKRLNTLIEANRPLPGQEPSRRFVDMPRRGYGRRRQPLPLPKDVERRNGERYGTTVDQLTEEQYTELGLERLARELAPKLNEHNSYTESDGINPSDIQTIARAMFETPGWNPLRRELYRGKEYYSDILLRLTELIDEDPELSDLRSGLSSLRYPILRLEDFEKKTILATQALDTLYSMSNVVPEIDTNSKNFASLVVSMMNGKPVENTDPLTRFQGMDVERQVQLVNGVMGGDMGDLARLSETKGSKKLLDQIIDQTEEELRRRGIQIQRDTNLEPIQEPLVRRQALEVLGLKNESELSVSHVPALMAYFTTFYLEQSTLSWKPSFRIFQHIISIYLGTALRNSGIDDARISTIGNIFGSSINEYNPILNVNYTDR